MSDPVRRFRALLDRWLIGYCTTIGADPALYIDRDIHQEEATGFLQALDAGLVTVDDSARCSFPHLRAYQEPRVFTKSTRLGEPIIALRDELPTHVAIVGYLVLDYGWPREQIEVEPGNWSFDVGAFVEGELVQPVIAAEAKGSSRGVDDLKRQLEANTGEERSRVYTGNEGGKKYLGLLQYRPSYLWCLAPGARITYRVEYGNETAIVTQIDDIPAYPQAIG